MNSPTNFRPGPPALLPDRHPLAPGTFYDLAQAAPVRFHEPPLPCAPPPPPLAPPLLRVRPDARRGATAVVPSKALLCAIPHLKAGAAIELVPPVRRGGTWHLDTRATAPRRLQRGRPRFSTGPLSREHYLVPAVAARPGHKGGCTGTGLVRDRLTFLLGPQVENHPGYYELVPVP